MKKIYLLTDYDGLQEIERTKKDLKKSFFENYKHRRNLDKVKEYTVYEITYDEKKYDYDWGYGEFWMFEKSKELENGNVDDIIEYDDYGKHGIIQKEIKKDFLYLKNIKNDRLRKNLQKQH